MSIAKVHDVKRAQKAPGDGKCDKCGAEIKKGDPYLWWTVGFRSGYKHVRCTSCPRPRWSELESNDKLSMVWAANEQLETSLAAATCPNDVKEALEAAGSEVRAAADEWADAVSNLEDTFPGSNNLEPMQEQQNQAEELADALEQADLEDLPEDAEWDKLGAKAKEELMETLRDQAQNVWADSCNF